MSVRSNEQNIICARNRTIKDLEQQLADANKFIDTVGRYIDGYILNDNSFHAMNRIMQNHDKLKEK